MSFNKLTRQLRREATKNPKKAAFLGLMLVVALWFWSPLLLGTIGEKKPSAVAVPHAASPDTAPTIVAGVDATAPSATEVAEHSWSTLARWIDGDRLTLATGLADHRRDPFRMPQSRRDEAGGGPDEEMPEGITPESLGLALSGTIVGPGRRVALIGGTPYRQGRHVVVSKDKKEIRFRLETIESRRVVLRHGDKRFELTTEPEKLPGRIERTD